MTEDALDLLQLVLSRYANCKSYSDSGCAWSKSSKINFSTRFSRREGFEFEWRKAGTEESNVILETSSGADLLINGKSKPVNSLDYALTIASGATLSVSSFIGRLLLRKAEESELLQLAPYLSFEEDLGTRKLIALSSDASNPARREILRVEPENLNIVERELFLGNKVLNDVPLDHFSQGDEEFEFLKNQDSNADASVHLKVEFNKVSVTD